jgi:short-subunit dehydrogenase
MDWAGRVAVVTGASSGIGRQLALDFAARGAALSLVARRAERLEQVAESCRERGADALVIPGDLADPELPGAVVARTLERFGRLDVLVNNAGVPKHKQFFDVTPQDVEHTLRVNFLAAAQLTVAALPHMLGRGEGFVVNISSGAGRIPPPRETVYAASKYALTGFSEGLAIDLAGSGIHTAVIHVGPIDTEIWEKAASEAPTRFRGRKYPPSLVSDAVFDCLERRRHERTVPRWLRLMFAVHHFLPGLFRRGAVRYDPIPPELIEAARRRASGRSLGRVGDGGRSTQAAR